MTVDIIRFPLDPSGTSPTNRVQHEPHTLPNRKIRVFVPNSGAYFVKSMVLYDGMTNLPLTKDQWRPAELSAKASRKYGQNICYVVLIVDPTVSSTVYVDYQALGGQYMTASEAVISQIEALNLDNREVSYQDITGLPTEFNPSKHLHDAGDIYGMESIVHAINRAASAVATNDTAMHDVILRYVDSVLSSTMSTQTSINSVLQSHIANTNNPHRVTAALINAYTKGEIDAKFAASNTSISNHIANKNNPHGVTPGKINAYTKSETDTLFQTLLSPINASLQSHISNLNNPHKLTPGGLGTYSSAEIDALTNNLSAAVNSHLTNYGNPHKVTADQINAYTKDAIDSLISAHTSRTDNPHQLTAALLNAYTKPEIDALLALKQDKATAVTLDNFNALWDRRMAQRFAFTYITPVVKYDLIIPANTANYNLYNSLLAAGWNGKDVVQITLTINGTAIVYSTGTDKPALDTGTGFPAGCTIAIVNNGLIAGAGGNGGATGWDYIPGYAGLPGGTGLKVQTPVTFTNNGTIAGGGGGGGGGGGVYGGAYPGSGGGGQGYNSAAPGAVTGAGSGTSGSGTAPGTGGVATGTGGSGGNGGSWGQPGANGANGSASAGGAGGAAGKGVDGNANVTWVNKGTIYGPQV